MKHVISTLALVIGACAPDGATLRLRFDHQDTVTARGSATTPTTFAMRMKAVYIVEDVAPDMSNAGDLGIHIWQSPACSDDLRTCGSVDFFELALPPEQVNANLTAATAEVMPGTYRYIRMELPNEAGTTTMRVGDGASTWEDRFRGNGFTVAIEPPLELAAGESVEISLGYDLVGSYYADPGNRANEPPEGISHEVWYCSDYATDPASGPCIAFAGFAPTVTRIAAPTASP